VPATALPFAVATCTVTALAVPSRRITVTSASPPPTPL
jgi:hypothetical protein